MYPVFRNMVHSWTFKKILIFGNICFRLRNCQSVWTKYSLATNIVQLDIYCNKVDNSRKRNMQVQSVTNLMQKKNNKTKIILMQETEMAEVRSSNIFSNLREKIGPEILLLE